MEEEKKRTGKKECSDEKRKLLLNYIRDASDQQTGKEKTTKRRKFNGTEYKSFFLTNKLLRIQQENVLTKRSTFEFRIINQEYYDGLDVF